MAKTYTIEITEQEIDEGATLRIGLSCEELHLKIGRIFPPGHPPYRAQALEELLQALLDEL